MNDQDVLFVSALVEKAGRLAVEMRDGVDIKCKDGPDDKVTAADIALSKIICDGLKQRFPDDCVVSEEDSSHLFENLGKRVWLVDPIDGTQNYILDDGQYCVMVGLLVDRKPYYGWVYAPTTDRLYHGGPGYGAFERLRPLVAGDRSLKANDHARILMGSRDRNNHPWVMQLTNVSLVRSGSVGLKVALILEGKADIFVHLSCKLKVWDTAGPAAIALGAGLELGTTGGAELDFPLPSIIHQTSVVMGIPGALAWAGAHLEQFTFN